MMYWSGCWKTGGNTGRYPVTEGIPVYRGWQAGAAGYVCKGPEILQGIAGGDTDKVAQLDDPEVLLAMQRKYGMINL